MRLWRADRHGFLSLNRFQYDRTPHSGSSAFRGYSPTLGKCARRPSGHRNPDIGRPQREGEFVQRQSFYDRAVASDFNSTSNRIAQKAIFASGLSALGKALSGAWDHLANRGVVFKLAPCTSARFRSKVGRSTITPTAPAGRIIMARREIRTIGMLFEVSTS
jgi:hypothetical protein